MTTKSRWRDGGAWLVALSAALTLVSVSLFLCPTAHAGGTVSAPAATAANAPTEAAKTAMTLESDDDGDELLEHWGDPKYGREERTQIAGIVGALCAAGAAGAWRRRARRRAHASGF